MAFDLSRLDDIGPRWVRVGLDDMEVQIAHVGPREQERWRQALVSQGIMRVGKAGHEIARGRELDFFHAYAERYVLGWRNITIDGVENPPYDIKIMATRVLAKSDNAFKAVAAAVEDETLFFSTNGDGTKG